MHLSMPATAVVEQQATHIPAEWLLQLGCLLGSVAARRSDDLSIAWRLDDRISSRRRGGGSNRERGSSRSQQRGDVLDFHVISLVGLAPLGTKDSLTYPVTPVIPADIQLRFLLG